MRASGDLGRRQLLLFGGDLLDRLPACIDHAVVGIAPVPVSAGRTGTALLMDDVGADLVPEGDGVIPADEEECFIDAMAALHAAYQGFAGDDTLISLAMHYTFLSEATAAVEAERGATDQVPRLIALGWGRLNSMSPAVARLVRGLLDDPSRSSSRSRPPRRRSSTATGSSATSAAARTAAPSSSTGTGVSRGPGTLDLAWYLAVNCDRLAHSKEELVVLYRARLEAHGVDTAGVVRALAPRLGLVGAFLQLGWNKLGGDPDELAWWEARIADAAPLLGG